MFNKCFKSFYNRQCRFFIKRFSSKYHFKPAKLEDLELDYLCNPANKEEIRYNIQRRKGVGDIEKVLKLYQTWKSSFGDIKESIGEELLETALKIPNRTVAQSLSLGEDPVVVRTIRGEEGLGGKGAEFHELASRLNLCRTDTSNYTGPRSYYFLDDLAKLQDSLVKYAISRLMKAGFQLISVPDILPRQVIEYCGMDTRGDRNQVYSLDCKQQEDVCLSGTAEMGIAYYLSQRRIRSEDLPLRITAVSRCFRAEASKIAEEKGVYRVHQFTKVEMFGVTDSLGSDKLLEEFVELEEDLFKSLGLKLRTLEMPPAELGAQAGRKLDVEAWLPGRQIWGELSSASNCTDYQSRRLGIRSEAGFLHTINGTACAVPRLILALIETHQTQDGRLLLPNVLTKFMDSNVLRRSRVPCLTPFKQRINFFKP